MSPLYLFYMVGIVYSYSPEQLLMITRFGPRHVLLASDKNRFKELAQQIACEDIIANLKAWNPEKWRNYLVRLVCSTDGEFASTILFPELSDGRQLNNNNAETIL